MSPEALRKARSGAVLLTLAAAAARSGDGARAKKALADFRAANPDVDSIRAVKAWMLPTSYVAGYEPLFDGLRKAGMPDG